MIRISLVFKDKLRDALVVARSDSSVWPKMRSQVAQHVSPTVACVHETMLSRLTPVLLKVTNHVLRCCLTSCLMQPDAKSSEGLGLIAGAGDDSSSIALSGGDALASPAAYKSHRLKPASVMPIGAVTSPVQQKSAHQNDVSDDSAAMTVTPARRRRKKSSKRLHKKLERTASPTEVRPVDDGGDTHLATIGQTLDDMTV